MIPRPRRQQAQDGRIVLRRNDHRDIILDDEYVNALVMNIKTEGEAEAKDQVIWRKYPHKQVFLNIKNGQYGTGQWGWLDVEREFTYSELDGINQSRQIIQLKDYLLYITFGTTARFKVSQDGIVWKQKTFSQNNMFDFNKFSDNQIVRFWSNDSTNLTAYVGTINDYETDDFNITFQAYSFTVESIGSGNFHYICDTNNGCLVLTRNSQTSGQWKYSVYEISEGRAEKMAEIYTRSGGAVFNRMTGCRKGSFYAFVFSDWTNYVNYDYVFYSNDKTTWQGIELRHFNSESASDQTYMHLFERNNWFYIYSIGAKALKAWKSDTGVQWVELNLVDYIDVPVLSGESGKGTNPNPDFDTLRIILNKDGDIPSDGVTSRFIGDLDQIIANRSMFNRNVNNVMMVDGEINTTEEFIGLHGSSTANEQIHVFIDNLIFLNTADNHNFAWVTQDDGNSEHPDPLIDGDYCLGGGGGNTEQDQQGQTDWSDNIDYHGGE